MGYVEKKSVNGKTYYYLTETKRVSGKWRKTRKYLGVHTPAGFEKPRRAKPKPILSETEKKIVELIKRNYNAEHELGPNLWKEKEERDRLVSFVFNTNAIEGNSLSLEETDSVLAGKKIASAAKKEKDVREAENMKECVDYLFSRVSKGKNADLTEEMVLKLHEIEMQGVMPDAGAYRKVDVRVGSYYCPPHEEVGKLMRRFIEWYDEAKGVTPAFELAGLAHVRFVRIHPFRDGNGRVARLVMNFLLIRNGFPFLNIFNDDKLLYYLVLRKVDESKRFKPFVKYLFKVYAAQYKDYLKKELRELKDSK